MGILNSIKEKIFGKGGAEVKPSPSAPVSAAAGQETSVTAESMAAALKAGQTNAAPVDVEAVLEAAVKAKGVKFNWRESIVDLMKALDLDSSLAARRELAADLKYTGTDPDGSAGKNVWLHRELMKTLAANGGRLPKELL
jgi:hypothetical protein